MQLIASAPRRLGSLFAFALALPAGAQQFVDSTTTNFPQPAPLEYTNQLTIGDLDGDGDLDIIFANGQGFSSEGVALRQRVYINNGAGVFTDESVTRMNFAGWARGVELGDIDNDGDLDAILAQDFNELPRLFLNDGLGFFTDVTAARLPNITLSSSRAQFGDIDNDGDLDLYITSGTTSRFTCGQYRVYVNDGLGFFTDETALRHPIANVCNNMDCIFGDIDGDFDIDVKTASTGTNNSRLYRNDGTGVFTLAATVPADEGTYSYDFGDMDGDGDLDLLGANAGPGTTDLLLANDGTGTYSNASGQMNTNPNQDDNDSKFFDYDNDGDMDFIIARLGGAEKIYNNNGADFFTLTSGVITSVTDSSLDVKVADLDNDGDLDIVTAQGESGGFTNRIYINSGPADTIAPRIIDTEQLPDTDDTAGPYVVRALVLDDHSSDRNFFDKGVTLHYAVGAGPEQTVPMRFSGGQVYRGEMPGQPGGTVTYYVTATDWNDNTGVGDTMSFDVTGGDILGDVNGDGTVDVLDFLELLATWGPCPGPCPPSCPADFDGDCEVGILDFLTVLAEWD
jgi:hypothetical protein